MNLNFDAQFNPPAAAQVIDDLEARCGHSLPPAYRKLLSLANGFATDHILLYNAEAVVERNITFELAKYAPNFFTIGDDGGGMAILLAKDAADPKVYYADHGSLGRQHVLASSLEEWLAQEPAIDEEDVEEYPGHYPIDVYLERMPNGGPKALLQIKQVLGLDTSIGQLKAAAEAGNTRILSNVPYQKFRMRCQTLGATADCLKLFVAGDHSKPLRIV